MSVGEGPGYSDSDDGTVGIFRYCAISRAYVLLQIYFPLVQIFVMQRSPSFALPEAKRIGVLLLAFSLT